MRATVTLERYFLRSYRNYGMALRKLRDGLLWGLVVVSLSDSKMAAGQLSRHEGDRLQGKIDAITKNAAAVTVQTMKTSVSESEANSYLAFNMKDKIPKGLTNPEITMLGDGRLAGRVLVDLDEFKRHRRSSGFLDPLAYISGKVPVTARGLLRTQDGKGQFQLGSAQIHGFPLPKPILQELVTYFSRTPEHPEGFNMDAPFNLPAKIREVVVRNGETVVAQ